MNTYDDSLLGTRFALVAPEPLAGSWDDVLGRAGASRKSSRRQLIIAFAVVAVAAAVAAAAVGAVRDFVLRTGFIGLPPIGATPSSPASGELEIWYWAPWAANGKEGRTRAWVYADGRLITWGGPDRPGSANPLSTGYLEQRLTPEGVELLRFEIAAAGDFGDPDELEPPGKPPCPKGVSPSEGDCQLPTPEPAPDAPVRVGFATPIVVAGLGTLVHVDHARDLTRLFARLSDPESWLPASAWVEKDVRAYVASKYAVCYSGWPPDQQIGRSRILVLLPPVVRDLLGDAPLRQGPLFGEPGNFRPSYEYCSDMTTDEARAVAVALDDAGFHEDGSSRLNYRIEAPGSNPGEAYVWFEPYLPHGEITCSVCG
ncbi:MAG TPA: hypothetical protein VLB86_06965 [Gaiellaceae bacterium]|nr:hypothetical protein [Gaiellaceae bacterium]